MKRCSYKKDGAIYGSQRLFYYLLFNWCLSFQAECYHYLFDAAIKLHQLGLECSTPDHGPIRNFKGVLGCGGHISTSVKAGADSNHEIEPLRVSL